jgi:predicted small lipoprotein YifL
MKNLFLIILALALAGCGSVAPLKGGKASTVNKPTQGIEQSVVQSENPAAVSKQDQETVRTKSYTVPTGSRMVETRVLADTGGAPVTNVSALVISAPMAVTEHEETRATTELGAAQKDTARELSAKLASLKGIVWVGVALFLFGLATLFYPPLKLIIGSVTTSVAITVGGLALIVLPTLIVGNELLILGGVAAAVGLWFFAHRHGQLRGLVDSAKAAVDEPATKV